MIQLEHVSKSFAEGIPALNDVSLHISEGEFVFVVGDSGSGTSTLIKLLLKELEPTSGNITINDINIRKLPHRKVPYFRRNIGCVFQDFRLLKDRNVYENVAFAQRVIGTPTKIMRRKVPAVLSMVGLAAKYKSYPREISGGEQQRVSIARALVKKPRIILADEPTAALDYETSIEVLTVLEEVIKSGTTLLMVTHNEEIAKMANRVIRMKGGVVAEVIVNRHPASAKELVW